MLKKRKKEEEEEKRKVDMYDVPCKDTICAVHYPKANESFVSNDENETFT